MNTSRRGIFGILGGLFAAPALLEIEQHVPLKQVLHVPPEPMKVAMWPEPPADAKFEATIRVGQVVSVNILNAGSGYTVPPTIYFSGGGSA